MTFLAPGYLLLLFGVVALIAGYVLLQRRRRHYAVRFTNLELLDSVAPKRPGWRRHVAAAATAVGLAALVLALARPVRDEQIPKDEAVVMLVVDTSGSMDATDVSPSRLIAAQAAATDFVEGLPEGFQVGLITYDRNVTVQTAPTTDHDAVTAALGNLVTGPGTATGDALQQALAVVKTTQDANAQANPSEASTDDPTAATIVLVSDGVSTVGSDVATAAQAAADQDVPVTTIAYGTADASVVVDGETVPVPADPASMKAVADTSGGQYFAAASASELDQVYKTIQTRVGYDTEQREILRTFLGLGLVALILAAAASMLWTARML